MKALRLLMPIVIAVGLGPLIAALALGLLGFALDLWEQRSWEPVTDLVPMLSFDVIFAYVIGWPIALLAGVLVSLWMSRHPPNAIVVVLAAILATSAYMAVGALGLLGPVEFTNARANFLFTLVLAIIAAAGCWFLTRRFARLT